MVNTLVSNKAGPGVPSSVTVTSAVQVSIPPQVQLTIPVTAFILTANGQVSPPKVQPKVSAGRSASVALASKLLAWPHCPAAVAGRLLMAGVLLSSATVTGSVPSVSETCVSEHSTWTAQVPNP